MAKAAKALRVLRVGVVSLAVMACAAAFALARGSTSTPSGPRLSAIAISGETISLQIRGVRRGVARQGRYRASRGHWRRISLDAHTRRWKVTHLKPSISYLFELRACPSTGHCGRWSKALRLEIRSMPSSPPPTPSPATTTVGAPTTPAPANGPCQIFPKDNPINQEIANAPANPNSASYVASIGAGGYLHPNFGTNPYDGIPYSVVGSEQPKVPIMFTAFGAHSDPGPYPVPLNAPVEGNGLNGDRHVVVLQEGTCKLYELFDAHRAGNGWDAESGAVFDLRSNALRPNGWTSADAAGLPIYHLLVRYEEVQSGQIDHALRMSVAQTQEGFIHPATHFSSDSTNPSLPPMGLRLRLKASFDLSHYYGQALVILQALKRYGVYVADNGNSWFLFGNYDPRWNERDLKQLETVPGSQFEAVQTGSILHIG